MASDDETVHDTERRSVLGIASLLGSLGIGAAAVLGTAGVGGLAGATVAATAAGLLPVLITSVLASTTARRRLSRIRAKNVTPEERQSLLEDLARLDPRVVQEAIRHIDVYDSMRTTLTDLVTHLDAPHTSDAAPAVNSSLKSMGQSDFGEEPHPGAKRVLARGVGVVVNGPDGEENHLVLPSGTAIPCTAEVPLSIAATGQSNFDVKITWGDGANVADCAMLAELSCALAPNAAASASVRLTIAVQDRAPLTVEVRATVDDELVGEAVVTYEENPATSGERPPD